MTKQLLVALAFGGATALTTINDVFLPGSQIGQSGNIETPDKCDNCHGGYNSAVEPAFNWRGSMMSQAARDPLFFACLAVANQDAPGVGDMCLRCHAPDGWLNGRCEPTDGSALNNNDRQGVQCDFCHKLVKPSEIGVNPFPSDAAYTSTGFGTGTYNADQAYLSKIIPIPGTPSNGMYIADAFNGKRGPFTDAVGRHQMLYSPFHSQSDLCGTCHDVSNPVFTRATITDPAYLPNTMDQQSETFNLRLMFPIERTYSEWQASSYNSTDKNLLKTCQDCHMKDVTGKGAKMNDAPVRTNLPLHDMTGGNTFVPQIIKQTHAAEVNAAALDAGVQRARNMLQSAATMQLNNEQRNLDADPDIDKITVKVTNNTGHKLPTGYPEGRRMWINVKFFNAAGALISESGAYNVSTADLTKTGTKIYECKPAISQLVADALNPTRPADKQLVPGPSFHMALNSEVAFDNRIPPRGFTNAKLIEVQSPVVGVTYADGQNWDETVYDCPAGTDKVEARLYYQTASKEYIEFLRDENYTNSKGQDMYNLWMAHGRSTPELMASAITGVITNNLMTPSILSVTRATDKKGITTATATILVKNNGQALSGAVVTTTYTGPTNGTVSGTTGTDGKVALKTTGIKSTSGTWCFTITNVTKLGYSHDGAKPTLCENQTPAAASMDAITSLSPGVQVFPNPFTDRLFFSFAAAESGNVIIDLYEMSGLKVATIFNNQVAAGTQLTISYNARPLANGMYLYRATINGRTYSGKLMYRK